MPVSYLDDHLLPDEHIVHRARVHWIIFGWPIFLILAGLAAILLLRLEFPLDQYWLAGVALIALALLAAIGPAIRYFSSDYAVTDKRVLAKYGLIRRESLETLLSKVEAIGVDQDVTGRLFNYGTLSITGTGGTRETLAMIPQPLEFRRRIQAQIVLLENRIRGGSGGPLAGILAEGTVPRVERECPYCAEPILAKAKICKHCGRDVSAAAE